MPGYCDRTTELEPLAALRRPPLTVCRRLEPPPTRNPPPEPAEHAAAPARVPPHAPQPRN
eukprot:5344896-Prymnesium_polylepis.1